MPKSSPIYTNFNSGVLSDLIAGRSDLEQYNKGGLDYKNLLVTQYGPFMFRPGSFYSDDTKTHAKKSRLLEFIFSPADAQIVEMGDLYFLFYDFEGKTVASEVVSTYLEAELFAVQYVQSNDVITLVHGLHKPAKLTRLTSTSWSLADYTFVGNPYLPDNAVAADLLTASVTALDATGTLTATGGHTPFLAGHVGTFWKVGEPTGSPEKQGFAEITGFTSTTVVDITVRSVLSTGSATKAWAEAAWSSVRGWPSRCWYVGSRLYFASTTTQPNGLWGSKPFIFDDFDPGTGLADDAISELLPASSEIQFLTGLRTLLIGTNVGDFVVTSTGTGPVTPENLDINQQTGWGSEAIQPKLIGSHAYAVQNKGRKLRELSYYFQEDSYKSVDTTVLAEHVTLSGIKDFSYQRDPYSIAICVLNNGTIATMTREVDQQVLGWTPWDMENGDAEFESVAVIPHPTEDHDMIWAIVKLDVDGTDERHVINFESPIIPARQELSFYVDNGLRYNAYESNTGGTLTLSALTGDGITATSGSAIFAAGNVGKRIRAIDITTGEVLGEFEITQFDSTTQVTGDITLDFDSLTYIANAWGISVNTVSGLGHLEAKTLKLLVDGGTAEDVLVASGSITLDEGDDDGFIIAVGLGYTGRWKNMPIEAGSATGTAQGKKKRIYQCGFKFYRSLGMQVGGDEAHLRDVRLRSADTLMGLVEGFFTGTVPPQKIDTTNDYEGHIVLEQSTPLPMCVTAVMPLLDTYDK